MNGDEKEYSNQQSVWQEHGDKLREGKWVKVDENRLMQGSNQLIRPQRKFQVLLQ